MFCSLSMEFSRDGVFVLSCLNTSIHDETTTARAIKCKVADT